MVSYDGFWITVIFVLGFLVWFFQKLQGGRIKELETKIKKLEDNQFKTNQHIFKKITEARNESRNAINGLRAHGGFKEIPAPAVPEVVKQFPPKKKKKLPAVKPQGPRPSITEILHKEWDNET